MSSPYHADVPPFLLVSFVKHYNWYSFRGARQRYTEDTEKIEKSKLFKPLTGDEMVLVENHLNAHFTFSILRLVVNNDITFLLLNP